LFLITYPLPEKIFSTWINFAKWWVPLTVILSILAGFGEQPSYMPAMMTPGTVSFLMSVIFLAVSLLIILKTWLKVRGSGAGK
jgi:hypothetical protein